MLALNEVQWAMLGILVALYVLSCVRIAVRAARLGKSGVRWFFITFFGPAVPAMIRVQRYYVEQQQKELADRKAAAAGPLGARRCPHCGGLLDLGDGGASGVRTCPTCRLPLDETDLA